MVLENPILPFNVWFLSNLTVFLLALLAAAAVGVFFGYLAASIRHGPVEAFRRIFQMFALACRELRDLSPRRLLAIARLAVQESLRRRVLVVFIIFVVALLFAGWFLDPNSNHPARLYLSFVLTATNYLVLILAVFISAFSLPQDMKNKTIYTVVTKPVRGWEIVVGRILGFVAVGSLLLALMGVFSYFFVQRGLRHEHTVDPQQLASESIEQDGTQYDQQRGETSRDRQHRHEFIVGDDGRIVVRADKDHTHDVAELPEDNRLGRYQLGPARGLLLARVPIRGKLRFLDPSGRPGEGINVGYEWAYRKYIEGGTLAAGIWRFENLDPAEFPEFLPVEMTLRVFRTYQGIIEQGITATIELVKPAPLGPDGQPTDVDGGLRSVASSFTVRDQGLYQRQIPRKIAAVDRQGNERVVDIFEDLTNENGDLEIWIRCLDREQYLGMAAPDIYLRATNRPFWLNFSKGYLSIWFQMVVVTTFGVAFSTFLSGAVAMIATLGALVMGFFKSFVTDVATGEMPGGGPLESFVRLITQKNQMTELDPGPTTWIIQSIDASLMHLIQAVSYAMPDAGQFNTSHFVAYGFDIPLNLMMQHAVITLAYVLVISTAGYFFFKSKEIAA